MKRVVFEKIRRRRVAYAEKYRARHIFHRSALALSIWTAVGDESSAAPMYV